MYSIVLYWTVLYCIMLYYITSHFITLYIYIYIIIIIIMYIYIIHIGNQIMHIIAYHLLQPIQRHLPTFQHVSEREGHIQERNYRSWTTRTLVFCMCAMFVFCDYWGSLLRFYLLNSYLGLAWACRLMFYQQQPLSLVFPCFPTQKFATLVRVVAPSFKELLCKALEFFLGAVDRMNIIKLIIQIRNPLFLFSGISLTWTSWS